MSKDEAKQVMTCPRLVSDRMQWAHFHTCGRPVAPGKDACAMHLAGDAKRASNDAAQRREGEESNAAQREARKVLTELGILGKPYYEIPLSGRGMGRYVRAVIIDIDDLLRWAREVSK
jgi:hypothetical protein